MVREIMKDTFFLSQPSAPATAEDIPVAEDLLETLIAHKEGCVGMAANMIGMSKRIIAFENDGGYMVMFNPEIVKCSEPFEAEESSFLWLVRARRNATGASKSSIRTINFRFGSRPSVVGRRRSSSMRLTTATVLLSDRLCIRH